MQWKEKSTQSCSPYLRWKQCTSFVTIITIFPRSRARNAWMTRSVKGSDDVEPRRESSQGAGALTHLLSLAPKRSSSHSPFTANHSLSFVLNHTAAARSIGLKRGHEDQEHETSAAEPAERLRPGLPGSPRLRGRSWGSDSRTLQGRGQPFRSKDQLLQEPPHLPQPSASQTRL